MTRSRANTPRQRKPAREWPAARVERRKLADLHPYAANARVHTPEQIRQIADSIQQWGWTMPVLVDPENTIIAGHARAQAAALLKLRDVPVIVAHGWSAAEIAAYVIADNQLALNAGWSAELLAQEVSELAAGAFDVRAIGFGEAELVHLLHASAPPTDTTREWEGMPAFHQDNLMPFRSIVVRFTDQPALDDFLRRLGQSITAKTKFLWHPELQRVAQAVKRWIADGKSATPTEPGMEYGRALPPDFNIPKALRFMIKGDLERTNPFAGVILRPGDRVMDVGACVGTFSAAALEQGAGAVRCYEPVPKNFAILSANMARYGDRVTPINAALIAGDASTVTMSAAGFMGSASIRLRPQDKTAERPALSFRAELAAFRPHVLKVDIEGGEYALLDSLHHGDLAGVRSLFIEFHPDAEREARVAKARAFLESDGFAVVNSRLRAFTLTRTAADAASIPDLHCQQGAMGKPPDGEGADGAGGAVPRGGGKPGARPVRRRDRPRAPAGAGSGLST